MYLLYLLWALSSTYFIFARCLILASKAQKLKKANDNLALKTKEFKSKDTALKKSERSCKELNEKLEASHRSLSLKILLHGSGRLQMVAVKKLWKMMLNVRTNTRSMLKRRTHHHVEHHRLPHLPIVHPIVLHPRNLRPDVRLIMLEGVIKEQNVRRNMLRRFVKCSVD